MKWKLRAPDAPMLVYCLVKLTGLAPFTVKGGRFFPPTLSGKIYSIFLAATYVLVVLTALSPMRTKVDAGNYSLPAKIGSDIRYFVSIASIFITLVMFLMMYEKIVYIMNKLSFISSKIERRGIKGNRGRFFRNFLTITVAMNAGLITLCVMLSFTLPRWPISLSIKYAIVSWFKFNTVLIFSQMLLFIRQQFTLLNEKLYKVFRPGGHLRSLDRLHMFVVCWNPAEETRPDYEDLTNLQRVQEIEILHFELCDLLDRTITLFAIPILLSIFQSSTDLMLCCYRMYFILHNASRLQSSAGITLYILAPLLRTVTVFAQVLPIAYASETTCREGNAMKTVLSKVWYICKSRYLEAELFLFSLHLTHRPVTVSAFMSFDLDYSYVYKVFCVVVAYVITMIQFDAAKINGDSWNFDQDISYALED